MCTTRFFIQGGSLLLAVSLLTGCSNFPNLFAKKEPAPVAKQLNTQVLTYKLEDLDNRTADHSSPDAVVYIAPNFDDSKPIHLIVYNHGMMTSLDDVEQTWEISKSMQYAAPNTVLVAPEWAVKPSALDDNAGKFHQSGFFKNMLAEIMQKVAPLQNKSLNDIQDIALTSFSGGLYPLVSELNRNGLEAKVTSITLFDSLYKGRALDNWLQANIKQLASGEKQFQNFYFHTYPQSLEQLQRVKQMLSSAKLDSSKCLRADTDNGNTVLAANRIAKKPIIFKYGVHFDEQWTGHNAVPHVYIPEVLKANAIRQHQQNTQLATSKETKPM